LKFSQFSTDSAEQLTHGIYNQIFALSLPGSEYFIEIVVEQFTSKVSISFFLSFFLSFFIFTSIFGLSLLSVRSEQKGKRKRRERERFQLEA